MDSPLSVAIARWENEGGLALPVETPGAPLLRDPAAPPEPTSLSTRPRSVDPAGRGVKNPKPAD